MNVRAGKEARYWSFYIRTTRRTQSFRTFSSTKPNTLLQHLLKIFVSIASHQNNLLEGMQSIEAFRVSPQWSWPLALSLLISNEDEAAYLFSEVDRLSMYNPVSSTSCALGSSLPTEEGHLLLLNGLSPGGRLCFSIGKPAYG